MNVIQPFRRRIIIEALIKTLLICLLIFGVAMVGVAATYIILHESLVIIIGTVLSGLLNIIISIPIFLRSKAKKLRQLNYRLDALGLDERVSTMAEFRHDKSYVAQMQREDTIKVLSGLSVKALRIKKSKVMISIIAFVLAFAMMLFIFATPINAAFDLKNQQQNNQNDVIPPEEQEDEKTLEDEIKEDFKEMEDIIEDSEMSEPEKDEVKDNLDDIKDKVDDILKDDNKTEEEKKDAIEDVLREEQNQLDNKINRDEESKQQIADKLQNNEYKDSEDKFKQEMGEIFEQLGEAIEKNDKEQIKDALDKLEDMINSTNPETGEKEELTDDQKQENADKVADALDGLIDNTQVYPSDMKEAISDYIDDLHNNKENADKQEAEDQANGENTTDKDYFEEELDKTTDKLEQGITDANDRLDTEKELSDKITDTREDLVGSDKVDINDMMDDIKDMVNNSDIPPSVKNEIREELGNLQDKVDNMLENDATKSEISAEIQESKEKIEDLIQKGQNEFTDQFKPDNSNQEDGTNQDNPIHNPDVEQAIQDANQALQDANKESSDTAEKDFEGAQDKIENAFDSIRDQLKNETTGEWLKGEALKEQLGNMAQDFQEAADSLPDGEAKDIWQGLADAFEQAKNEAAEGKEDEAIDTATGAIDKAEGQFNEALGKLENMENAKEDISDRFTEGQNDMMGLGGNKKPEQDKDSPSKDESDKQEGSNNNKEENQEKPEGEGEGENEQPDPDKPSSGNGSASETDKHDKINIPGLGEVTLEELFNLGFLDGEYDKQFSRELTDEERDTIENYFASLKPQK